MTTILYLCLSLTPTQTDDVVVPLAAGKSIVFLSVEHGRAAIIDETNDAYFRSLSPIDFELRLGSEAPLTSFDSKNRLLKEQYQKAVQPWAPAEIDALTAACRVVFAAAEANIPGFVPVEWKFVKTSGSEESNGAYTRGDVIILPQSRVDEGVRTGGRRYQLARLVAHETSHVFTRTHPELRERLYSRIGFRNVGVIDLGDALSARKLTNPDGPTIEHVLRIRTPDGREADVALAIYSNSPHLTPEKGRNLFQYLATGLFVAEPIDGGPAGRYRVVASPGQMPTPHSVGAVHGFYEQVGRNTNYIIHPDEIIAENLAIHLTQHLPDAPPAQLDMLLLKSLASLAVGGKP